MAGCEGACATNAPSPPLIRSRPLCSSRPNEGLVARVGSGAPDIPVTGGAFTENALRCGDGADSAAPIVVPLASSSGVSRWMDEVHTSWRPPSSDR